ncbi:MAG: RNA polymerase sigma factor [Sedimentisphaerales bacterium]|nr:RNA polymerase sigma factor [Sedimentisphaerales bacterium]
MKNPVGTTASLPQAAGDSPLPDASDLMAVVTHYQSPLLRYVGRMLDGVASDGEDIVQEAFVRLHRQVARHGSSSIKNLTTWLYRVAHNLTIDARRRQLRQKYLDKVTVDSDVLSAEQVSDEFDALGEVLRREARQVALRELSRLDDLQRQVVLLKIIQGLTLREVAEVVGISVSMVNYRLNQGLNELAQRLRKAGVV